MLAIINYYIIITKFKREIFPHILIRIRVSIAIIYTRDTFAARIATFAFAIMAIYVANLGLQKHDLVHVCALIERVRAVL